MRRSLHSLCSIWLSLALLSAGGLHAAPVLIVASSNKPHYQLAVDTVRDKLQASVQSTLLAEHGALGTDVELIITLGAKAAHAIGHGRPGVPWLAALISSADYRKLPLADGTGFAAPTATLLLDQPLHRQIQLARRVLPDLRRLGLLLSADNELELPSMPGVELVVQRVTDDSNIVLQQESLLREVDGLLAVPDREIFNRRTVHGLLLSAYRLGKPVIGYSKPLVKAGALLSAYCTPDQLGQQIAVTARRMLQGDQVRAIDHPSEYRVAVNFGIARALGLAPIDPSIEERTFKDERP